MEAMQEGNKEEKDATEIFLELAARQSYYLHYFLPRVFQLVYR